MAQSPVSLEDRLRILANAGELSHLSIIPTAGKGPGGVVFSASYSPASNWGHGFGRDPDPVKAIIAALEDDKFKTLMKKLKIDTTVLPTVEPTPLTKAELAKVAGKPAPDPEPAMAPAEEEEPWLKEP